MCETLPMKADIWSFPPSVASKVKLSFHCCWKARACHIATCAEGVYVGPQCFEQVLAVSDVFRYFLAVYYPRQTQHLNYQILSTFFVTF